MKILVVEDENEIRELIVMMLESNFQVTAEEAGSGNEAIEILKKDPSFLCVISDFNMEDGTGGDVFEYLQAQPQPIPFILCSGRKIGDFPVFNKKPPYAVVEKPHIFPALETVVANLIESKNVPKTVPEYCRIRTSTILSFGLLDSDLYIKLNDNKFIRVMREGDMFDSNDYTRFNSKNLTFLFLKTTDAKRVLERMTGDLMKLTQAKTAETPDQSAYIDLSTASLEAITEFNRVLGFDPKVQALTKETVKLALKTIQRNTELAQLFAQLTLNQKKHLASHSITLAHLSCGIASLMGWVSELTFYKLTTASLMHDLPLQSNRLSAIHTKKELMEQQPPLTGEEIIRFERHPESSAYLVNQMTDIPSDVDTIVRQHHERPDGSGFPNGLEFSQIHPLAAVLIMAEELISYRSKISNTAQLSVFVNVLKAEFYKEPFKKITEAITRSLIDQHS